jgi:hypothetical protein
MEKRPAQWNPDVTPQQFLSKWQRVTLSERAACQQHFLDLCELLGQPKPAAAEESRVPRASTTHAEAWA